jgi:hypothetical protein
MLTAPKNTLLWDILSLTEEFKYKLPLYLTN